MSDGRRRPAHADVRLPVFVDDSGRRDRWVRIAMRTVVTFFVLGTAAVVISVLGGVPLPGLTPPAPLPQGEPAHAAGTLPAAVPEPGRPRDAGSQHRRPRRTGVAPGSSSRNAAGAPTSVPGRARRATRSGGPSAPPAGTTSARSRSGRPSTTPSGRASTTPARPSTTPAGPSTTPAGPTTTPVSPSTSPTGRRTSPTARRTTPTRRHTTPVRRITPPGKTRSPRVAPSTSQPAVAG